MIIAPGEAIPPVDTFADLTAHSDEPRASFVGDEEVGTMTTARFEEKDVRFV